MTGAATSAEGPAHGLEHAIRLTEALASGIGPRRPASPAEAAAAELVREELTRAGLQASVEPFRSWGTFAGPYGAIYAVALAAGLLPARRRVLRSTLALSAVALASAEGGLSQRSPLARFAPGASRNVFAVLEPRERVERTLCLVSHLDSSRSGLMFHPTVTPHLAPLVGTVGTAILAQGAEPLLGGRSWGRRLLHAARGIVGAAAVMTAEREMRGDDVPGANDNASGVGACVALAAEAAPAGLARTRLAVLVTGSEESGVYGMRSFLRTHDTRGWLFLNFDGVGAPADLHYLRREGGTLKSWEADPGLVAVADRVADEHPRLGLTGTDRSSGLPYDATAVLAAGGRALTLSVQNGSIPNYHWPTDTADRLDRDVFGRALAAGRELVAAIDRGEADL